MFKNDFKMFLNGFQNVFKRILLCFEESLTHITLITFRLQNRLQCRHHPGQPIETRHSCRLLLLTFVWSWRGSLGVSLHTAAGHSDSLWPKRPQRPGKDSLFNLSLVGLSVNQFSDPQERFASRSSATSASLAQ